MADASPLKWHLAHTTWFFETFVLERFARNHTPFHPAYRYLYNSYYNAIGEQYPRARRGLLSRPALDDILRYRQHTNAGMTALLATQALARMPGIIDGCAYALGQADLPVNAFEQQRL